MAKSNSPSFILEKKLLTSQSDERALDLRLCYAWRIKVQLVKYARKQLDKLASDKEYHLLLQERKSLPAGTGSRRKEINSALSAIRMNYGLSQYQFKLWVQPLQHRYGKHIDSRTAQCVADDIWKAIDRFLFDKGKTVHIPKRNDVNSIKGNDNKTGIRYRNGRILWNGLSIGVARDKSNDYENMALQHRIKYCRIVRKAFSGRWHYYVQLVLEGVPPKKHEVKAGRVGIDPGTMSAAVVSEKQCILTALDNGVPDYQPKIRRIQRALDRSRRSLNPGNYHPDGTVKRGRKRWVYSRSYWRLQLAKHSLERKRSAALKTHHEVLANTVLSLGNEIYTEEMCYSGLQRRAKETTRNSRGRYNRKSRFGKSLRNGAPALFLSILNRKLTFEGRELHKVNTRSFRASQYNHVTDEYVKKRLSRRHNMIAGRWVQRDLYSAFLLMNSADDLQAADRERCIQNYHTFLTNHDACITNIANSNDKLLSSFGISRTA